MSHKGDYQNLLGEARYHIRHSPLFTTVKSKAIALSDLNEALSRAEQYEARGGYHHRMQVCRDTIARLTRFNQLAKTQDSEGV